MAKNLLHSVIRSTNRTPGLVNTHDIIEKIESGYLADNRNGYRQKKSFSPSTLVYNFGACFAGETKFLTDHGYKRLDECVGQQVVVWTGRPAGRKGVLTSAGWKPATVESFGQQEIWNLVVSKNGVKKTIRTTGNHRWLTRRGCEKRIDRGRVAIVPTAELEIGDPLEYAGSEPVRADISPDGIRHGFVFGDGYVDITKPHGGSIAILFGKKDEALTPYFQGYSGGIVETRECCNVHHVRYRGLPRLYKSAPSMNESNGYLYGFLAGYFAADGNVNDGGTASISSANIDNLKMVADVCGRLRIGHGEISGNMRMGINGVESMIYSISLNCHDLTDDFFIHEHHKEHYRRLIANGARNHGRWKVVSICPTGHYEEVYCVVQPETEQFTLESDILTKNCPRYWFLAFHGAEFIEENTPYQVANMRSGTLGHERIQKAMEDAGIMLSKEEPIRYSNPPIFGYQDAELLINDAPLPIEIKTTNDASFMRRKETGTALNYHIAQLAIYMYVRDKDMGAILYENKNTHELLMIPVEMDERIKSWVEQMLEWCRTVKATSDANTIPKKTYRSNSKICKSCPVKDACMNADIGEIIINPLEQLA